LRMVTLYYIANQLGYMVAGSGNRSELTVGYFTKYGDGGVDILPLGNLVKSQVRELARCLGIPREIIDKPPSAGLWEGQTDEAEMGLSYEALDNFILTGKATEEVREKVEAMKLKVEEKMKDKEQKKLDKKNKETELPAISGVQIETSSGATMIVTEATDDGAMGGNGKGKNK